MGDIRIDEVKHIKIVESGSGIIRSWDFNEFDARVLYDALKEYFDDNTPTNG